MKEITLNAMILQILYRKGRFFLLILIPLLAGMTFGLVRSAGRTGPNPPGPAVTDYRQIQYDALESLYEAELAQMESSLLLNMDPSRVYSRRHTIFIDESNPQSGAGEVVRSNEAIGYYYAWYKFTPADYEVFRQILGDPALSTSQIDEVVVQAYNNDLNLLTLAATHTNGDVAKALGEYNYKRIMALFEDQTAPDHELKLIGDLSGEGADDTILARINEKVTRLNGYRQKMDELRPALAVGEQSPGTSLGTLMRAMFKWGILGLMGGIALAMISAAILAARSDEITDLEMLESEAAGAPFLGFIPRGRQTLPQRLVFGRVTAETVRANLLLRLALNQKNQADPVLRVISLDTESAELTGQLCDGLPLASIRTLDPQDPMKMAELSAPDQVLIIASPRVHRPVLRQLTDLITRTGAAPFILIQGE